MHTEPPIKRFPMISLLRQPVDRRRSAALKNAKLNPYETPLAIPDDSTFGDGGSSTFRRVIPRPTFAIAWTGSLLLLVIGSVLLMDRIDPIPTIDFSLYLRLYAAIGSVIGILSWSAARRVAMNRITFRFLSVAILLPYAFFTLLAVSANPPFAILVTVLTGSTLTLAYLVRPIES